MSKRLHVNLFEMNCVSHIVHGLWVHRVNPEFTVGTVLAQFGGFNRERFFVAGTPSVVADEIEKWLDEDGIDGINLRQYLSFETARDFIELVTPELRRRGRFRETYTTVRRCASACSEPGRHVCRTTISAPVIVIRRHCAHRRARCVLRIQRPDKHHLSQA
ncbi:hypothetical protein [Pseudomonas sp. LB3P14]